MARGWESKSVESQIEDRQEARGGRRSGRSEELERSQRRESLEATRRRVQHDLENARSDSHRTALQNALKHLDGELRGLDR